MTIRLPVGSGPENVIILTTTGTTVIYMTMVKFQIQLNDSDCLRVENYWHSNKVSSRSEGIRLLLRSALNASEVGAEVKTPQQTQPEEHWKGKVADYIKGKVEVTALEVLRDGIGIQNPNHTEMIMVARTLRDLGYFRFQKRIGSGRRWSYRNLFSENEEMNSPWGEIQTSEVIAPGIVRVTTAAHGGLRVSTDMLSVMPEYMRHDSGWYEEDQEWAFVFAVFEKEIRKHGSERDIRALDGGFHLKTLAHEWPEEFAMWEARYAA